MPRVKRGVHHSKRRRGILESAKGFKWGRKSKLKLAKVAVIKAGAHGRRDRRTKKRTARTLWSVKINAAARLHGLSYSRLIDALAKKQVLVDRKILAQIAEHNPAIFAEIVKKVTA